MLVVINDSKQLLKLELFRFLSSDIFKRLFLCFLRAIRLGCLQVGSQMSHLHGGGQTVIDQ